MAWIRVLGKGTSTHAAAAAAAVATVCLRLPAQLSVDQPEGMESFQLPPCTLYIRLHRRCMSRSCLSNKET